MRITLVQMNSQDEIEANLAFVEESVRSAVRDDQADLIVLPEYFAFLDDDPLRRQKSGEEFVNISRGLAGIARENKVNLHAGSIVEPRDGRFYNTTLVFDTNGREIARYSKIHMFDIDSPDGTTHRESDFVTGGRDVVVYKLGELTVGCAICYDLRFPELFRKLRDKGADLIILPSAFTLATGKDHWEVLIRARAIETQTYVVAAAQIGRFAAGRRQSWGHSMVVDPWGHVVAQASDGVGTITARIEPSYISRIRAAIPVANHHVLA
jgi:predicted amidohydrolase